LPRIEVLAQAPRRTESWQPIALDSITAGQADLARLVDDVRRQYRQAHGDYTGADAKLPLLPRFGRLLVDGIEFACRDITTPLGPLLLGPGCDELVIPVNRVVKGIAVLGHVAMRNGYPAPGPTAPTPGAMAPEVAPPLGSLAAEYVFEFEDGTVTQPLRHGIEILRSNNICRWWTPAPRAAETRPAVRSFIDKSYEDLRFDLWEHRFAESRHLNNLRWRLNDSGAILAILAISTC
jgi:hypothetical protein